MIDKKLKTLKVCIIGEPNSGKSTLLNRIFKKKYAIVTRKAQTTIKKNAVVFHKEDKQLIFIDTPGIKPYKNKLKREIFKEASNAALESDLILLLLNIKKDKLEKIKIFIDYIKQFEKQYLVILNKIDLINKKNFLEKIKNLKENNIDSTFFSISAKKGLGVESLKNYIIENYKYTKDKVFSNMDLSKDNYFLEEIVREKVLENIHEEIPFNLKFSTEKIIENNDKSLTVHITIKLLKNSYKPIILGEKGKNIKKISMLARKELEKNLNKKFHLYLYLKLIKKNKINTSLGLKK